MLKGKMKELCCLCRSVQIRVWDISPCWGRGSQALLMRPAADGKKLILWREVLVLMEGSVSKSLCPGWEGSATILVEVLKQSLSILFSFISPGLVPSLSL